MNRRSFLERVGLIIGGAAVSKYLGGCFLDAKGLAEPRDGSINPVDAGSEINPELDPYIDAGTDADADGGSTDGGPRCDYTNDALAELIFEKIPLNEGASDLEQMIRDQRVPQGFTLGQIFDSADASGTAYTWAGFEARYDSKPEVKTALYSDMNVRISQVTCTTYDAEMLAIIDELTRQMFGHGSNPSNFELRRSITGEDQPKSVYLASMIGEDEVERTYIVLIGAMVRKDGSQPPEPMALYFTPVDSTFNTLFNIEQGGI